MPDSPTRGLPDISIRQLEYLVAVADFPTWAAAANSVGVSASALSQGLSELERRIGVELFESVGRRRVLRSTARPALDHARNVVSLTRDLTRWADRLESAQSGRIAVGMIDVAAVEYFASILRSFRDDRPDVELRLSVAPSRRLLDDLQGGRLDLVVCVAAPEPVAGVEIVALMQEPLVVYAPPDVVIGPPSTWGPWVLFPDDSHTRRLVVDQLARLGAPVDVVAESHQPEVLREMVLLGLGWTVLPRSQGEAAPNGPTVGQQLLERDLVIATRAGSVRDPAADVLAASLLGVELPRRATAADRADRHGRSSA